MRWNLLVCNPLDLPPCPLLKIDVTFSFSSLQRFPLTNVTWWRGLPLHTFSICLLKLTLEWDSGKCFLFFGGIPESYRAVFWLCYNGQFAEETTNGEEFYLIKFSKLISMKWGCSHRPAYYRPPGLCQMRITQKNFNSQRWKE